jgi:amino acid adenylation domain-containing protein
MWLGQELDPDVPLYNMIQTFQFDGPIETDAFAKAWQAVVDRSDALRTTINVADGVPFGVVRDQRTAEVEIIDLRGDDEPEIAAERWMEERKVITLDLSEQLWDTALILLDDTRSIWYLCQHHLISDGQSFAVVYQRVAEYYQLALDDRLVDAPELPAYADYLDYERELKSTAGWAKAADYWRARAAAPPDPISLYGQSSSGRSARTDRLVFDIGAERSAKVREIAAAPEFESLSEELSLFTIWATLLFTALHRITGQTELRIGTPFLARPTPAFRETIGLFIEIGALDVAVIDEETFPTLGRRVQREVIQGLRHAKAGTSSADLNRSYDILLNSVTSRFEPFAGIPVTTDWLHTGYGDRDHIVRLQVSDFDSSGAFRLHFDVNAEDIDEVRRGWLLEQFEQVLDHFLDEYSMPIGGFDLLSSPDRTHQIDDFNDTDADYPRDVTVVDLFEQQVVATPDATAVQDRERELSYAELDAEANRIARLLRQHGVRDGATVAICAPRSIHAVTAIMGVLKAGGAFVPVDPTYPAVRRQLMIDDADPVVVLTVGSDVAEAGGTAGRIVVDLEDRSPNADDRPADTAAISLDRRPGGIAYMIYTSGSTGRPKGTMLSHQGLVNYLWWAKEQYQDGEVLDFPLYSSLAFDLTITSLFVPLISGGRVVVYEGSGHGDGLEILDVFEDDVVDIVKLTPAHLGLLREHGINSRRIRRLIVGGENFRTELARDINELFDHDVVIFNEYGPTEAVVGCMIHRYDPATDNGPSVPIGRPAANSRIHVLDSYDQPVPPGVVGEIVISSDGVALGYRGQPELTAARFGDDPTRAGARWYRTGDLARWGADRRLEFLGRDDDQVKIRGARIELGDVETALLSHPDIEAAVVDVVVFEDVLSGAVEHCVVCGLPSNYPGSDFDADGECGDCRAYSRHREEVDRYFRTPEELHSVLDAVAGRADGQRYDCVVLVSGGKDSTYMLYQLVREFGVRPLVFTLDNGYIADAALENVRAACADLGVDLHVGSTPHMNEIFVDSLERHANVCDGCYKTIYTLSINLAHDHGVGTIITGLARGQLFETRLADTFAIREFDPDTIDAWILEARKAYHHIDDAVHRLLDTDLFADEEIFDEVGIVDYYRYVDVDLDEVYRYLQTETTWTRPVDTGRSTNCLINDVGIHVHSSTRGYHNYALPYSWDVRLGHKRREAAMDELDDDLDVERVRHILGEIRFEQPVHDLGSEKRLAAYYVASVELTPSDLRAHVEASLPDFMVPSYLVPLEALPLTVNGKVDRAALPDPGHARPALDSVFVAPRTEQERLLAEVWIEVFRLPEIGVHDNFFDLGGDSIMSIQIVAECRRRGIAISPRDIFANQTVAELAEAAGRVVAESTLPIDPPDGVAEITPADLVRVTALLGGVESRAAMEDVLALTPTQLGMIYHCLRSPESGAYFGQGASTFDGDVDEVILQQAWKNVCQRHPATRVRFLWSGLDTPVQVVQRDVEFPWEVHDWRGRDAATTSAGLEALLAEARRVAFDLAGEYLMSFVLIRTDETTHFVWHSHHALLDGWSAHILYREAITEYEELVAGRGGSRRPGSSFHSQVSWLAQQDKSAAQQWWQDQLGDVEETTPIPVIAVEAEGSGKNLSVVQRLDLSLSNRVMAFARGQRITLSTLANCAWGLLLSHYSGSRDVMFGTTISGREEGIDGVEDVVGMLIATLPTRLRTNGDQTVGQWLRRAQRDSLEARRHGHLGLADIHRLTSVPAAEPLFDSIVVIENYPKAEGDQHSTLRESAMEIGAPSNYPLALLVHPGEQLELEAVYDSSRMSEGDVERLAGHLRATLESMIDNADSPLSEVSVVSDDERELVRGWSVAPEVAGAASLVPGLIAAQATLEPSAVAVVAFDGELSYDELERRGNQLARGLRDLGVTKGQCVGLVAGGSKWLVAGVNAILKSGGAYVPLDRDLPPERLAHVIKEAGISFVLSVDGEIEPADGTRITTLALTDFSYDSYDDAPLPDQPEPDDVAYVIYTSGSTGVPKGVMITHANIAHSTSARFAFYDEPVGAFLLLSSMAFDSSMVGLFWTLCSGGTVVVPPYEQRHNVRHLAEMIEVNRVTHMLALPSLHGVLLDETPAARLASLRVVIVAGEACPSSLLARHREKCGGALLYNEYGPTEGTVWSHAHRVDTAAGADAGVPIGTPIPNSWCRVVDCFGHETPVGLPGELLIGGPGVALGYLERADLTADSFVQLSSLYRPDLVGLHYRTGDLVRWRDDGLLEFIGRVDRQVKVRGHRIELGEVEAALIDVPDVQAAAVLVVEADNGANRKLVAWYCGEAGIDDVHLRSNLAQRLPRYMLPSSFVRLDTMPLTSTGKIDVRALPRPVFDSRPTVPAESEGMTGIEQTMLEIWRKVLGRNDISRHDDFFDLGGNSLDAMRLFARIEQATGREMLLSSLFDAPTIAGLAQVLGEQPADPASSALVAIKPDGYKRPFFYVAPYQVSVLELAKIGKHFQSDRPFFGLQPSGLRAGEVVHRTVEEIADHFIDAIKTVQPHGPYLLGGHCDGTWIAHQMAVQLADRGETVAYLGLTDLSPPATERPTTDHITRVVDRLRYYRRDGRLWYALQWKVKERLENAFLLRFGGPGARRVREVRLAHKEAFNRFQFRHDYRTPVHMIRSTELAVLMDQMPWYGQLQAGDHEVTISDIDSTHARLLREPETVELAEVLAQQIDEVDRA